MNGPPLHPVREIAGKETILQSSRILADDGVQYLFIRDPPGIVSTQIIVEAIARGHSMESLTKEIAKPAFVVDAEADLGRLGESLPRGTEYIVLVRGSALLGLVLRKDLPKSGAPPPDEDRGGSSFDHSAPEPPKRDRRGIKSQLKERYPLPVIVRPNDGEVSPFFKTTQGTLVERFIASTEDPLNHIEELYAVLEDKGFFLDDAGRAIIRSEVERYMGQAGQVPADEAEAVPASEPPPSSTEEEGPLVACQRDSVGLVFNPNHGMHAAADTSPENPERIQRIFDLIATRTKLKGRVCHVTCAEPVEESVLLTVHSQRYVDFIRSYAANGGGYLGDSTYVTPASYDIARTAVAGAIKSAELVLDGRVPVAFGLIRPPGHHASQERYGGYCLFNNAAILARYLQGRGLRKIMIVDWDSHAANGTMEIFYSDKEVFLVSLHQDPSHFYPGTGFINQTGKGEGRGTTVNVPMPEGSSDREYVRVFQEIVIPLMREFEPDFVIGCNGFDGHHSDRYTKIELTSATYHWIADHLARMYSGRLVVLMEGGYTSRNGLLGLTLIHGLLGLPSPFAEDVDAYSLSTVRSKKTWKLLDRVIAEVREVHGEFHPCLR